VSAAHQHLATLDRGQLGQRRVQRADMVGAVVWGGLARPQIQRQRLPCAVFAVVDERAHRREPERLECRLGALLVRVRGHQCGIDVHDHLPAVASAGATGQRPAPGPDRRAGLRVRGPDRRQ
jgi:hypothetical protein